MCYMVAVRRVGVRLRPMNFSGGGIYDVKLTLPESDKILAKRLMDTGLKREQVWQAIENTAIIADQCNVKLPKLDRLRYPIAKEDWRSWT